MGQYFEFDVSLKGIRPRIWRRFLLHCDASFLDLHHAIQDACGWQDYHLFSFMEKGRFGEEVAGVSDDSAWSDPVSDAGNVRLREFFGPDGLFDECIYTYDFGDNWEHLVKLRKIVEIEESFDRRLLTGKRAFPTEDCGGIWGYQDCVAVANGEKKDKEFKEWLGDWSLEVFDLEATQNDFDQ